MSNPFNMFSDWLSDMQKNRDAAYEKGEINPEFAGNFAADALLPTDLIYTINKAARGEGVTGEDIALSAVDAVSTALGLVTFGAGKVAGAAAKTAVKAGKVLSPVVGAGGALGVGAVFDAAETTGDGNRDATPQNAATNGATTPFNITIVEQPRKTPERTDSQGLNDIMVAMLLAQAASAKNTYQPTQPQPQPQPTKSYLPYIGITAAGLVVVVLMILLIRR